MDTQTRPEQNPGEKNRGCLFYIAVAAGVLLTIAIILAASLIYGARNLLIDYTGTSAIPLPAVSMPAAQSEALAGRFKIFKESFERPPSGASLALGEDDINTLIAQDRKLKELAGKVYVAVGSDTIKTQMSVPLDKSGIPFTHGRYLNGEISLKASLDGGVLIAAIDSLVLNDKPFPEALMSGIRSVNAAQKIYERPKTAEALRKFESIRIKDGKLLLKLR